MVKQLDQSHLSAILRLLKENGLPVKDIDLKKQSFWGLVKQEQLIGIGALEIKGDSALLRSLAIDKNSQNMGLGNQLLTTMLELSKSKGIKNLFLLTETAEPFFKKNNFKNINRNQVPEEIAMTEEFKSICPSSAICMTLKIES
ncbi:arsenic resistance N-acetyltransferase ArsN2 [Fulvivirga lutimaris]|uniref:arsenic resistance N-acetyltransferase ArsN2 n=1 Tax=Fulvivirga lutimaris TaxID=1819566 RepID=UPI0012BB9835|nr:arsenic resistance N-acetyltransferase ArsN2 [Fulvivirga lutimaris]MTI40793.1 GNAT family N-acetyltransferase [Fulvivirga lutimaris]